MPVTSWMPNPEVHILAFFSTCARTEGRNANSEVIEYQSLLASKIIAVNSIESLVGRVRVKKGRNEWVLIDQSGALASTILLDPDQLQRQEQFSE